MKIPFPDSRHIDNALFVEHHVQRIITQQEKDGVQFDIRRGAFYIHSLHEEQLRLYRQIRPHLSMECQRPYTVPISKPWKKDGEFTDSTRRWAEKGSGVPFLESIGGPFSRIQYSEPDLGKRQRLVSQLLRLGWIPIHFTEKGNPKLTFEGNPCKSLESISSDIGREIAKWYICNHRKAQIQGLVNLTRSDGRISASAITIGTPTMRFRHRGVVNIPKAADHVFFGAKMRSLFIARDRGRRLVGHDAKGLELRTLAHYINDILFTKEVVSGDPHSKNQKDAGLPNRDDAKTFIYAFLYGAGDAKLGSIVGKGRVAGARLRRQFLKGNPKLAKLIKDTEEFGQRGHLLGLDGRKITLRKDKFTGKVQTHKSLNALNQSAGAIVMKWSMVILDLWVREMGLDVIKVIDMHDEGQADVALKDIPAYTMLARQSIIRAGEMLNLNVPLDADVKVGLNWAKTH